MWTLTRWFSVVLIAGAAGIQFIRPARTNPPTDPARTLTATMRVPDDTRRVLERACRDCHSNDTRWPWYSNVAPVSWFVIDHVNHGRQHFNYSDWAKYDQKEQQKMLKESCSLARKGDMPMPSYTWMHSDARLSDADVEALCSWTQQSARTRSAEVPGCRSPEC